MPPFPHDFFKLSQEKRRVLSLDVREVLPDLIWDLSFDSVRRRFTRMGDATSIISAINQGDPHAADELLPLVYEDLRRIARAKMAKEGSGHTLQPTALVHEAWSRLVGAGNPTFEGRAHFFAAAAEAMRRILIESARRKSSGKRGSRPERVELDDVQIEAKADDMQLLQISDELDLFAMESPRRAELFKLRFFVGMTNDEAAEAMGISPETAKHHWAFARAWFHLKLFPPDRH
jgi:RNA polymerase sigma factor (TIGR02999 family)